MLEKFTKTQAQRYWRKSWSDNRDSTKWLMGGYYIYSMVTLYKEMIHILGRVEQNNKKFHYSTGNGV